jgi:hypothetical protein
MFVIIITVIRFGSPVAGKSQFYITVIITVRVVVLNGSYYRWGLVRCAVGKSMQANTSASASSMAAAGLGSFGRSWSATLRHCALAAPASSCAMAVAMKAEATPQECPHAAGERGPDR